MITSILLNQTYTTILMTSTFLVSVGIAAYIHFHEDDLIKRPIVYRNLVIICVVSAILFFLCMLIK